MNKYKVTYDVQDALWKYNVRSNLVVWYVEFLSTLEKPQ